MALKMELKQKRSHQPLSHPPYDYHMPWSEKYQPESVKDLVVHSSKVKAVREWLLNSNHHSGDSRQDVLLLCGCSGCSKSTLVKILCQELKINLIEWTDDLFEAQSTSPVFNSNSHSLPIDRSFRDSVKQFGDSNEEENDAFEFAIRSSYPSLIDGTPKQPKKKNSFSEIHENERNIVLIHDPLSLLPPRSEFKTSSGISNLLLSFRCPIVLIVSDVVGKDDTYHAIDQIIPSSCQQWYFLFDDQLHTYQTIPHRFNLATVFCPPITERNVQKVLAKIAATEFRLLRRELIGKFQGSSLEVSMPSIEDMQEISVGCLGDLRQAISTLQLLMHGLSRDFVLGTPGRDKGYSMLHGIGKLLYARRGHQSEILSFNPEEVFRRYFLLIRLITLDSLDLPLDIAISFLQWNSFAIFDAIARENNISSPDLSEDPLSRLEQSCQWFSDCQVLMDRQYTTDEFLDRSNGDDSHSFPGEYVVALGSRVAIATSSALVPDEIEEVDEFDTAPLSVESHRGSKKQKYSKETSTRKSGLVYVRRPKSLEIRTKSSLLTSKLIRLRNELASTKNNLLSGSEVTTTCLPYLRYFFSTPTRLSWPESLQYSLHLICKQGVEHIDGGDEQKPLKSHRKNTKSDLNVQKRETDSQFFEEIGTFSD